jgi:hypothetical protein
MNGQHRRWVLAAACVAAALRLATTAWAQSLPFAEPFDDRAAGALHNQNQWTAQRQNDAQVQTNTVYGGTQAAAITTNAMAWHDFSDSSGTNVWVDFYARASYPANAAPPVLTGSVAAAFFINQAGVVQATSNGSWVALNCTVPASVWRRFTVHLDYVSQTWDLYVADETPNRLSTKVAESIPFSSLNTNTYFRRFRVKN